MKLVTYSHADGPPRAGLLDGDDVVDIGAASDGTLPSDLLALLGVDGWERRVAAIATSAGHKIARAAARLHAPIARPGKLLAAAGNYQAHVDEGGGARVDTSRRTPRIFLKPATTVIAHDAPLRLPTVSSEVDWEVELAIVIGRPVHDVSPAAALDAVAGYMTLNDVSARSMDWGIDDREVHEWDRFFDWLVGKWIDGFAPAGPWLVTADEIADPDDLGLRLTVNGQLWQQATTADMIFDCRQLIAFCSRICTLEPGDIIATGTPAGTGVASGVFLQPGDEMVASVDQLGEIVTPVVGATG